MTERRAANTCGDSVDGSIAIGLLTNSCNLSGREGWLSPASIYIGWAHGLDNLIECEVLAHVVLFLTS